MKAGEGGKLFGAVSSKEIGQAIKDTYGIEIDKKKILLEAPIRTIGAHAIGVKLHREVTAEITVQVTEE